MVTRPNELTFDKLDSCSCSGCIDNTCGNSGENRSRPQNLSHQNVSRKTSAGTAANGYCSQFRQSLKLVFAKCMYACVFLRYFYAQ